MKQSVLNAALSLAGKHPLSELTIEGIAREAGVGKQTIYRWWPSKAAVVFEALQEVAVANIHLDPTDDPRADLLRFLEATFRVLNTPVGLVVRSLMTDAQQDPVFREQFRTEFITLRRQALIRLLLSYRPEADGEFLADLIFGAMWYRLLVGHGPLDAEFAGSLVRVVEKI